MIRFLLSSALSAFLLFSDGNAASADELGDLKQAIVNLTTILNNNKTALDDDAKSKLGDLGKAIVGIDCRLNPDVTTCELDRLDKAVAGWENTRQPLVAFTGPQVAKVWSIIGRVGKLPAQRPGDSVVQALRLATALVPSTTQPIDRVVVSDELAKLLKPLADTATANGPAQNLSPSDLAVMLANAKAAGDSLFRIELIGPVGAVENAAVRTAGALTALKDAKATLGPTSGARIAIDNAYKSEADVSDATSFAVRAAKRLQSAMSPPANPAKTAKDLTDAIEEAYSAEITGGDPTWVATRAVTRLISALGKTPATPAPDLAKALEGLSPLISVRLPSRVVLHGAWYGDIRQLQASWTPKPSQSGERFCAATTVVANQCSPANTAATPGVCKAITTTTPNTDIDAAKLCGYDPVPFTDPRWKGLVVSYGCRSPSGETPMPQLVLQAGSLESIRCP